MANVLSFWSDKQYNWVLLGDPILEKDQEY